jgi:hypothetical protein
MEYADSTKPMVGVVEGVSYGQNCRVDELNDRILDRFHPDHALPPNFETRPMSTKYSLFPMLDKRMPPTVSIESNYDYSMETNFTPPVSATGPVNGFINNVNVESNLRNQFFALQKGADRSEYVPSSNSDLYKVTVVSRPEEQPYPLLFKNSVILDKNLHANIRDNPHIGKDTFHNYTRTQLRNGKTNDKC